MNIQFYLRAWLVFWAAAIPGLSAETIVLPPAADTTLHQKFPDNNVGGHFDFASGGVATGEATRGLIRFNLDGAIPRGAQITSAKLTVRVTKAPSDGGSNSIFELRRMMQSWSEGTKSGLAGEAATSGETTWNSRIHPGTAWSAGGGRAGTDFASQASAAIEISGRTNYTFASTPSLTADLQFWLDNPQTNFGWILISRDEATAETARRFGSREDPANAPTLTVEYAAGRPELRIISLVTEQTNGVVTWQGGAPPYQLQHRASLGSGAWQDVGRSTPNTSSPFSNTGAMNFFRVVEVAPAPPIPETAQYQLTFKSDWSAKSHPQQFPSGSHWSPLIGGTHNSTVKFWEEGMLATQGIQDVAELGSVVALRQEVNAAIANQSANKVLLRSSGIPGQGTVSMTFTADKDFPLVTIVTMIAPSPDWFTGLQGLNLIENNRWIEQKTVVLGLYDAGTDSGKSYNSLDANTQPRQVIRQITGFPALVDGVLVPFATITLTRK